MGRSPTRILYWGDSVVDTETAKRASVALVVVLPEVTPCATFREYEPRAILHDLRELPALLDG